MVRRSMGRRCREAMCAGALRHRRANFAPSPTPTTPTKVVARLAREELRVSLLSPASRRSPSSRFFPAPNDRTPARQGASNISSPMAGPGSFSRWVILAGDSVLVAWIGLAGVSGVFEILQNFIPGRSPSLFDVLASSGGLTLGLAVGAILTAALAWDRADELLNADRGAAFLPALWFRRGHDPGND